MKTAITELTQTIATLEKENKLIRDKYRLLLEAYVDTNQYGNIKLAKDEVRRIWMKEIEP